MSADSNKDHPWGGFVLGGLLYVCVFCFLTTATVWGSYVPEGFDVGVAKGNAEFHRRPALAMLPSSESNCLLGWVFVLLQLNSSPMKH